MTRQEDLKEEARRYKDVNKQLLAELQSLRLLRDQLHGMHKQLRKTIESEEHPKNQLQESGYIFAKFPAKSCFP